MRSDIEKKWAVQAAWLLVLQSAYMPNKKSKKPTRQKKPRKKRMHREGNSKGRGAMSSLRGGTRTLAGADWLWAGLVILGALFLAHRYGLF